MKPQELATILFLKGEKEGWPLLQQYLPDFDDTSVALLAELIKREADRQWNEDARASYILSGHLLSIGSLTNNKAYYALGLMSRGDALRRLERDREAITFLDAAGAEFREIGDEVAWARTRIGRISACLQLNRTSEALQDAAAAREVFMRHGKL